MNHDEQSKLVDQRENIRGQSLRVCRSEIALLRDAVLAHGRGKHYVTIDHMERVIDALKRLETFLMTANCD